MINHLLEGARFLYENKRFKQAATVLDYATPFIQNVEVLNNIYNNQRMCYFQANDVPNAYRVLELQEKLPIKQSWEILRDKSNFLRYLNRHEEAYEIAKKISDDRMRNLALSWFEHKAGNTKLAFELTELARENSYWWKNEPPYSHKLWRGQKVKNLIVRAESGFGDQIIFARWIPQLKDRCSNLYYEGPGLEEVFSRNFGIQKFSNILNFDDVYLVPVMSLPNILAINEPQIEVYLQSDTNLAKYYLSTYPKSKPLRIGICVQGERTHVETNLRTLPLKELVDELINLGEIVNLQKEISDRDDRIKYIPFDTWEDTLALIDTCDVIVSCDTSVAHAAASMGKQTIVLMHAAAYFTWNHNVDCGRSLWYKNAWCIHQDRVCIWDESIVKCGKLIRDLENKNEFSI